MLKLNNENSCKININCVNEDDQLLGKVTCHKGTNLLFVIISGECDDWTKPFVELRTNALEKVYDSYELRKIYSDELAITDTDNDRIFIVQGDNNNAYDIFRLLFDEDGNYIVNNGSMKRVR